MWLASIGAAKLELQRLYCELDYDYQTSTIVLSKDVVFHNLPFCTYMGTWTEIFVISKIGLVWLKRFGLNQKIFSSTKIVWDMQKDRALL